MGEIRRKKMQSLLSGNRLKEMILNIAAKRGGRGELAQLDQEEELLLIRHVHPASSRIEDSGPLPRTESTL